MDWFDYSWKFASEILVLGLAVVVAGCNLFFFPPSSKSAAPDNSLAAQFLNNHYSLNKQLYAKNSSIVTTVARYNDFIAEASANDFEGLSADQDTTSATDPDTDGSLDMMDSTGLLAPNPDSIKAAVTNVSKKVYFTLPGDTLQSIAAANGISPNSIKWSNNLTSDSISPGWNLIIPPVDGVAVTADSNTTLPDLAYEYNPQRYNPNAQVRDAAAAQLLDTIISYNGLDSAEDINPGDFIVIPGGVVSTPPPTPTPTPRKYSAPATGGGNDNVTSIGSGYDGINHLFPVGYCTYYVATKMNITFGGNARNWLANAKASGYVTGSAPATRAAVVFSGYGYGRYGHVAYVESVDDGTITVSEMNYDHFDRVDERTLSVNDPAIRGYIYP